MLLISKASLEFKNEKPAEKIVFGGGVINALTAAAASSDDPFKGLPVSIEDLQTATDTLTTAGQAAKSGTFTKIDAYETAIADWDKKFKQTADFVSFVSSTSNAPSELIRRGGFVPTKDATTPQPLPPASDSFAVSNNGKKGAVVAESKSRINFSKGYVYAALPVDANVEFQDDIMKITMGGSTCYIAADTRKKIEMYNLPKTPLSFFMYGFNAAGSGPACTPQSMTPGTVHG